ncbi:MAG: penicillin-binding protein 1B [Halomonadaceae bacterium]|nr:MAG: penicillin-binding protein 1B [Halomonadaceae bacterium]
MTNNRKKSPPVKRRSWSGLFLRLLLVAALLLTVWVVYLDHQVTSRFEGNRWEVPSRVFARALELYEGASLSPDALESELAALGYRRDGALSQPGTWHRQGNQLRLRSRGFQFPGGPESGRTLSLRFDNSTISQMRVEQGQPEPVVRLEPQAIGGIYPAHNEDRILIRLEQLPPLFREALIVTEDRDFADHWGLAPVSIARAMLANMRAGRVVQGGSTLTQQLVKNFYLTADRTYSRKLNEAMMAVLLELRYPKEEIFAAYLNEVYLGQAGQRSIHGIGLASQFYFGKPLSELEVQESALLVAMVRGPTYYNPRRHPQRATERRNLVLGLLEEQGNLSAGAARDARRAPLGVIEQPRFQANPYPAFMDLVRQHLKRDYDDKDLQSSGLRIFTTLDPQVQTTAARRLSETLDELSAGPGNDTLEGAMVITRPHSGEVQAVVGSRASGAMGFNRAVAARRPIGSLIKPAIYLSALEQPSRYTLISPLKDEPFRIEFRNGDEWSPKNFDGKSHGEVPLHQALSKSYNQATVRLGLDVGLDPVRDMLQRLGLERRPGSYPALLLGSLDLSPLQVTELYQTLAASGYQVPLRSITAVTTSDGEILSRYDLEIRQVVEPGPMHLLHYAMQETVRDGTGRGVYRFLPDAIHVAGKTGTTDGGRDTWFAGFTGNTLGVTWVGTDDNVPTLLSGGTGALRVWGRVMADLPQQSLAPVVPGNVDYHWIDTESGLLTAENCRDARRIPFIAGSAPTQTRPCGDTMGGRVQRWFERLF